MTIGVRRLGQVAAWIVALALATVLVTLASGAFADKAKGADEMESDEEIFSEFS